jgi:hypothetical protein
MTPFAYFLQHNYGVLVIAAITFMTVQGLAYLYRRQVARLSTMADVQQTENACHEETNRKLVATEELSRQSDEMARMQEEIRQLRNGLRLVEARLMGQPAHSKALAASALAQTHTGGLRHKRSRMAG